LNGEAGRGWLKYAKENLQLAAIALESGLLNPSLQNSQQAVEKALKAVWTGLGKPLRKTHCVADLAEDLASSGLDTGLTPEECDLLDSI
jgi:HEPN domain-containing protein